MKANLKNYYHPTPKRMRQIGDAFLATGVFITSGGLLAFDQLSQIFEPHELKIIIGIAFVIGALCKFVTNLFKDEDKSE